MKTLDVIFLLCALFLVLLTFDTHKKIQQSEEPVLKEQIYLITSSGVHSISQDTESKTDITPPPSDVPMFSGNKEDYIFMTRDEFNEFMQFFLNVRRMYFELEMHKANSDEYVNIY